MNTINICLASDDNYAKYAGVVAASILANAKEDEDIAIYILDGGISEENKQKILSLNSIKNCRIEFVNIDESLFEDYKSVQTHSYISIATYFRLKLPSLLPKVNRIIYFDCDFIVNSSLKELFNTDMGTCPAAGVVDLDKRKTRNNSSYVNAGMLVFDLDNMRKLNLETEFLAWTREHINTITLGDQEIINEVCKNNIKIVDDEWNVQSSNFTNRSSYTNNPKGIHFVSKKKPWHFASFSYHKPYYFKYLQLTPWALNEKEKKEVINKGQLVSLWRYFLYRPLFMMRPRFYKALFYTYIMPIFKGGK